MRRGPLALAASVVTLVCALGRGGPGRGLGADVGRPAGGPLRHLPGPRLSAQGARERAGAPAGARPLSVSLHSNRYGVTFSITTLPVPAAVPRLFTS